MAKEGFAYSFVKSAEKSYLLLMILIILLLMILIIALVEHGV